MGVTLKAPVADSKDYTDIVVTTLHFDKQGSDGYSVLIRCYGDDGGGNPIPDTRTDVRMDVPEGSGAPEFSVSGHAIERGLSPNFTLGRAAALTNLGDIFTKAETVVGNGLG